MTVLVWRILSIMALILFVVLVITLSTTRLLRNRYYYPFHLDEMIKNTKSINSDNYIYFTTGATKDYIPKYVICKTLYDKYLVCNFSREYKNITYFVVQYTRRKRVLSVLKCDERETTNSSKIISLNTRCKYVNVVVGTVNEQTINSNVIRPLSLKKIRTFAFLKSLLVFALIFTLRQVVIEVVNILYGGIYAKLMLTDLSNYLCVVISFVLCLLSYLINQGCLRRRNAKELSGGAIEYEFL